MTSLDVLRIRTDLEYTRGNSTEVHCPNGDISIHLLRAFKSGEAAAKANENCELIETLSYELEGDPTLVDDDGHQWLWQAYGFGLDDDLARVLPPEPGETTAEHFDRWARLIREAGIEDDYRRRCVEAGMRRIESLLGPGTVFDEAEALSAVATYILRKADGFKALEIALQRGPLDDPITNLRAINELASNLQP